MGKGVCVGVSVGVDVSVGRGVRVSVSVGTEVEVSVETMLVNVAADCGKGEAGIPTSLKLHARVANIQGMRKCKLLFFIV